ncbi:hypothetical protein ZWY2020_051718 [Hordeum vulgare]|nr:hypothetical protein ZWY2020_051718 [Hordeum vulgare]
MAAPATSDWPQSPMSWARAHDISDSPEWAGGQSRGEEQAESGRVARSRKAVGVRRRAGQDMGVRRLDFAGAGKGADVHRDSA